MNRRDFFKIVTTTGAVATLSGCQQASEKILPLVVPNEQIVPGVASYFATVCRECPAGCGVLAKNREGRVVKLEGNPDHPVNRGALCARGQAALQGAYHPDRFAGPQRRDGSAWKAVSWDDALKPVAAKLGELRQAGRGRAIALVSQLENGSLGALMDRWGQALGARRVAFEPFAYEALRAANRQVFGRDAIPEYAFEDAEVIVSFGADWAETWLGNVEYPRRFVKMHGFADGRAGTYIHIEPRQSLTAANADQWIRNAPGTEALIAQALLALIAEGGHGKEGPGKERRGKDAHAASRQGAVSAASIDVNAVAQASGVSVETLKHVAHALVQARPGLVVGGGMATTGSHAVATLVAINHLNAAIGAVGKTVRFGGDSAYARVTPYADVAALVQAMGAGEIEVLLLGPGVNPAFTLPGGLKVAEAIKRVGLVISFANQPDETTALAHVVLSDTHWLETWGDYSPREGVTGVMQPTMMPVRDSRPIGDTLIALGRAALGSEEGKGPLPWAGLDAYFKSVWEPVAKDRWAAVLHQGGVWKETAAAAVTAKPVAVAAAPAKLDGDAGGLALIAYPSLRFYDGRGASRAWLQEAPDAMTQVGWDAWVEIPAERARQLGIVRGDVVKVSSPHGAIELPAYVSPTLHPAAVAIPIGHRYAPYFTRLLASRGPNGSTMPYVQEAPTSMNPMALLPGVPDAASGGPSFLSVRVTLSRTGARRPLAVYQATHDQEEREIAQEVPLAAAREQALRGRPAAHAELSMYPPQHYPGYRWGLAIDVDRCVGCSACVVACIAENNVPVVGKADAAYGRQVHWLRIERWAEGPAEHPTNMFLPMLCVHCEVAPCEPVCPVFAAYRTEEGLNAQVYNRCVGTRYCGNNCPYHVRRFNWFNFQFPEPLNVQLNPDVTVRQLGVMEKCTMCIQRIVAGKDHARDEKRAVRDGDILTACQQTCPTQAITFGNLKDPQSTVTTLQRSPRSYGVLEELGTRPSVRHLKKVVREHA
ncbi:MAG: 4Fe-4S dicluster domain-containing protein [Candidatus Rokubacteria bacterium]|nr:4Fe-4S dicluster domain-containing protein [Candidatus Rokubacteria bacterium]MBI3825451.1 4Fe-4S dicluster domain-containing protein [Candidatus Rokubacteria bacterium]